MVKNRHELVPYTSRNNGNPTYDLLIYWSEIDQFDNRRTH
jgi:hypothetical protein